MLYRPDVATVYPLRAISARHVLTPVVVPMLMTLPSSVNGYGTSLRPGT